MRAVDRCHRRLEQIIEQLPLPDPFHMDRFLPALAEQRGRRIERVSAALPAKAPCGWLISTDDTDYIVHPRHTTALHAQHIDMHEIGHLLLHRNASNGTGDPIGSAARLLGDQSVDKLATRAVLRALLPDLSPALIRRILGRTAYTDDHEREAELFASLALFRRTWPIPASPLDLAGRLIQPDTPEPATRTGTPWVA